MRRPLDTSRTLAWLGAALLLISMPADAAAQSLFAEQGLGLVTEPQSARSTGLGGVPLGLPGLEITWSNPAGAVGLPAAGLLVSAQIDGFNATFGSREATGTTTRFPLVMAAFPFGRKFAVTAGFGGFLDQRWAVQQADTLIIGGDSLSVLDRVSSDGGVSRLRVGAGYLLAPQLAVGLGMDLYTGGSERVIGRIFPNESSPRCCTSRWEYSGTGALASLDWTPSAAMRVSLSLAKGGTLRAKPTIDTTQVGDRLGEARDYRLPASFTLGASGRVSANTLLAASAGWSGWSSINDALRTSGGARDIWSAHGGVEWDALSIIGRTVPLRIGGRYQELPFRAEGAAADSPFTNEKALSLGTGIILGGGATRSDISFERGRRGELAQGLEESFWRINFSVSVLGQ
jgi:hypothetical protein